MKQKQFTRILALTWLQAAAFVLLAADKPTGWSWFSLSMCMLFAAMCFGASLGADDT